MVRRNLNDLLYFVTVAREGSFTRAASLLGVTQSALSQAISGLEARLEIRLLTRTTRSVSPTAAGERLLNAIGHRFDEIETELDELTEMRDKPAGTVRITCGEHVLRTTLLPKLTPLLREYPDIKVEFDINYGFRDIVIDFIHELTDWQRSPVVSGTTVTSTPATTSRPAIGPGNSS
ncbi:regulatory helix-turn-helix protein, lysR family [Azotobacter beijerinckii]|uniref:Regulatory helix-turn-helix protein, lysR family n=1 Tax=Azotobacter beijerinckii TaxID=170623 RepID=A0A1H7AWW7_9GAMM|nr:regulatory helix-turn-helix protein, lysR family [Azotobacter beijerinckii]